MNLHEYQAKQLFAEYGLPVSRSAVIAAAEEAPEAIGGLEGERWAVKAQVHAGGRGKAGGVELVDSPEQARAFAEKWLGRNLATVQTDARGQPVNRILIEECADIETELYLGAVIDRSSGRVAFMASTEGGVEIEEVAEKTPEKILRQTIDPLLGPQPWQGRRLGYALGLDHRQVRQFSDIFVRLARMFADCDLALLEINPLAVTAAGDLHCLDAKINVDANALYRQPKISEMRDRSQEDEREAHAAEWSLSYVALDGDIGCMVNGAGLAMGTMDIIKLCGGAPANFLDVGGGATSERVAEAFKIILSDRNVKAVLINIFGGIVRCDLIAEGIIAAVREVGVDLPVVVRLEGNNAERGQALLAESGLEIIPAPGLREAAEQAAAAARA